MQSDDEYEEEEKRQEQYLLKKRMNEARNSMPPQKGESVHICAGMMRCDNCGRSGCQHSGLGKYVDLGDRLVAYSDYVKGWNKPRNWTKLPIKRLCIECLIELGET